MKRGTSKKGFTVIEVSLVLAIAGLIFLMVLIALPPLQRSQRDTARRESVMDLISQIKKYQNANRGMLPNGVGTLSVNNGFASGNAEVKEWVEFYNKYLGASFIDVDGSDYNPIIIKCATNISNKIESGQTCINDELTEGNESYKLDKLNYNLMIVLQSMCEGEKAIGTSNPRNLSVLLKLEGSGIYCSNT